MRDAKGNDAAAESQARPDLVQETRQRIEASWGAWLTALEGIPEERLSEVGVVGTWSVKDLLGHVAVWDDHAVMACQRLLAGKPRRAVDWRAMNEREHTVRADRSAVEQLAEMEASHARLVAFVAALSPADLRTVGVRPRLRLDTYAHYDEHAAHFRAWRKRAGL